MNLHDIDEFAVGTRPACDTCGEPAIVHEHGINHCPEHMAEELR